MGGWVDRLVDGWRDGWVCRRASGWMGGWVDAYLDGGTVRVGYGGASRMEEKISEESSAESDKVCW